MLMFSCYIALEIFKKNTLIIINEITKSCVSRKKHVKIVIKYK